MNLGLGTCDLLLGTGCLSLLSYPPHYQDFFIIENGLISDFHVILTICPNSCTESGNAKDLIIALPSLE